MYLVCTEELLEDFPGRGALGQPERRTGEQEAGGSIHDSEQVDEGAVASAELAFEVYAPDVVWLDAVRERLRPGHQVKTALARPDQAVALEDLLDCARSRPADPGPLELQQPEDLSGAPGGELLATCNDPADEALGRRGRSVVRSAGQLLE